MALEFRDSLFFLFCGNATADDPGGFWAFEKLVIIQPFSLLSLTWLFALMEV